MLDERSDTDFRRQLADINREFLRLLIDPSVAAVPGLFGLGGPALAELRHLSVAQLREIAAAPILLAEFEPLPGLPDCSSVADAPALPGGLPAAWQREAEAFANRLLACIWQAARQDRLFTAFCIGVDRDRHRRIAELSFRSISHSSEGTLRCLRVRLGAHARFWRDLVRSVRDGTSDQQTISRLAIIPLSVSINALPTTTTDRPRYF
jgi:hypothetical protein